MKLQRATIPSIACALCVFAGAVFAQSAGGARFQIKTDQAGQAEKSAGQVMWIQQEAAAQGAVAGGQGAAFWIQAEAERGLTFVSSEMSFQNKIVKGAPYSAEAVTEHVQTLADGNRIVRKSSSLMYRDADGRTRREQTLSAVGPWATEDAPQVTFINDPVAGVNYVLRPKDHSAQKFSIGGMSEGLASRHSEEEEHVVKLRAKTAEGSRAGRTGGRHEPKVESLGKQEFDGVVAEGTRTTLTIPAGEVGNELPMDIVSEVWYSPELQLVVSSKQTDPRFGESSFRMININRSAPARSLFEVPSDYTVKDVPIRAMRMRKPEENK